MSEHATLQFLPWMRRGVSRLVAGKADTFGWPQTGSTPGIISASVTVDGTRVTRDLSMRGPGDVVGLAPGQVLREDPPAGAQDAEANYFAAVELVSPDLPWMFTPAAANASGRLTPWLVLVVVQAREGITILSRAGVPLRVLSIDDARLELPDLDEAWAWVHVQATADLGEGVEQTFAARPEAFVSRLVCPRRLDRDSAYIACLVPCFESGRHAGLGLSVDADNVERAWTSETVEIELPVYHSWSFRTSRRSGDFESLARRLQPRTLPPTVGIHDLDIGEPGSDRLPEVPRTLVSFAGALLAPDVELREWRAKHRDAYQRGMRSILNEALTANNAVPVPATGYQPLLHDPLVAPPAYGALPAGTSAIPAPAASVSARAPRWLSESNLDPAHRSVCGLGVEVVRRNQESLLASAWKQAAGLREINRILNRSRLAAEVGKKTRSQFAALTPSTLLQITSGAHARLKGSDMAVTVYGRLQQSVIPNGLVTGAFRRRIRPGTTLAKAQARTAPPLATSITTRFLENPGEALLYASYVAPARMSYIDGGTAVTWTARPLTQDRIDTVLNHLPLPAPTPGAVFRTLTPRVRATSARPRLSTEPSATSASRHELLVRYVTSPRIVDRAAAGAVGLDALAAVVAQELDPVGVMAARVRSIIKAPISAWAGQQVPASMQTSPEFPEPLSHLLVRMDPELFMPGVSRVPKNAVALARINAAFVESFLLGANYELSREFLWREYPTDLADTWLRTFWNSVVDGVENIPPIGSWRPTQLGSHQRGMNVNNVLVLLIRSELLRRYPNTLIYAVAGKWNGSEREEDTSVTAEWPIFVGRLSSDITFLGFEFDVDVELHVKGSARPGDGRPGWFFVLEQPATEPRFGLDAGRTQQAGKVPRFWTNASWYHQLEADGQPTDVTHASALGRLLDQERPYDDDGENKWDEVWGRDAAAMARITLQRPVRMLIHADQMLETERKR